jgi:hypothetical protein
MYADCGQLSIRTHSGYPLACELGRESPELCAFLSLVPFPGEIGTDSAILVTVCAPYGKNSRQSKAYSCH